MKIIKLLTSLHTLGISTSDYVKVKSGTLHIDEHLRQKGKRTSSLNIACRNVESILIPTVTRIS